MGPLAVFLAVVVSSALLSGDDTTETFGGDLSGRRRLSELEVRELRKVYGDSLPWGRLRVRGKDIRGEDLAYVKIPRRQRRAARVVTVDRPYVRSLRAADGEVEDLYARSLGPLPEGPLLAHELMHSWLDYHRTGSRSLGTDAQAELLGLPDEAMYDLWWWVRQDLPFDQWPEEAKANAAAWYWNGLYHDPSDPEQSWYVRIPLVDRLFEHVRDHGQLPPWTATARPSSFAPSEPSRS